MPVKFASQNSTPLRDRTTSDKPCLPEYLYPNNKRANQRKQGCKPLLGEFDGQFIEQYPSYIAGFALYIKLRLTMATRSGIDGGVEVSFEFLRHVGGKYVHGAVGLQFDDHLPYEFVSVAVWPTSDNFENAVRETIEGVLMERLGKLARTRVTLKSIGWDDVASCEAGFRRAAKVATEAAFDV